jgi:hypothetical protein
MPSRPNSNIRRRLLSAVAAATLTLVAAPTHAQQPAEELELQQTLDALRHRVRDLQAVEARDTAATAAAVDQILRDAEQRSRLLADSPGGAAGFDKGFFIRSADGSFGLKPGVLFQFRNITDHRQNVAPDGDDVTEQGFEVRRLRFILAGNAFGPDLTYRLAWDTGREGGRPYLLDAWVSYKFAPDWGVRAGQFIDPYSAEHQMFPGNNLPVDVSVANELIAGAQCERVQGVSLRYGMYGKDNPINAEVAFHDGANSKNTDYRDTRRDPVTGLDTRPDWGVAGRFEVKAMGNWANHHDFTALGNKEDLLIFGASFDVTGATDQNLWFGTVDAQWEVGRLALYGALDVRHRDIRRDDDLTDWGVVLQAAYAIGSQCDIFARYSAVWFDTDFVPDEDTVHEITVGTSYYFVPATPHAVKLTVDLNYLPNGCPPLTGLGYAGGTGDAEWALRAQFQLSI